MLHRKKLTIAQIRKLNDFLNNLSESSTSPILSSLILERRISLNYSKIGQIVVKSSI